jgi:CubicO group peptidase (beta-lactamase class C family)
VAVLALAIAIAIALLLGVAFLSNPLYAERYLTLLRTGPLHPPLGFYQPKERIEGRNGGALPRTTPLEAQIDPIALERAAAYAGIRNTHALLVTRHGELVFERYWAGTDASTLESVHSFGKTLAALAVGLALGERRIHSVDEPAADYIEEWGGDARREITVRNLLQMSSGLQETAPSLAPWAPSVRQFIGTHITDEYLKLRLAHRAGIDWAHQNVDSQMLALIVERATGRRYADWISEKLWKPIGAGDAWLFLDRPGGTAHAECCLMTAPSDWLRIGELLLNDGVFQGSRVLPTGWVKTMLTPARGNRNYGFQLWLGSPFLAERPYSLARRKFANRASESYAADDVFFLDGAGKYRLWLVPSLGLAILRTGVDPPDPTDWDDARIPNLVIRGVRDRPALPSTAGGKVDLSTLVPGH